jgi:hypothetical protein
MVPAMNGLPLLAFDSLAVQLNAPLPSLTLRLLSTASPLSAGSPYRDERWLEQEQHSDANFGFVGYLVL